MPYRLEDIDAAFVQAPAASSSGLKPVSGSAQANSAAQPRCTAKVIFLPGQMPRVFAGRSKLPDLNAAAQANLPKYNWFDELPDSRKNDMLWALAAHPGFIPFADRPRPEWLPFLFAFADAGWRGASEARPVAQGWCETSPRFSGQADFDRDFNSFRPLPNGISVGTLLDAAERAGFDLSPWRDEAWGLTPTPASSIVSGVDTWDATHDWAQPDLIEFLYGGILARGFVTLLGAGGGTGKSAFMMAIAVCCALGQPLLGDEVLHRLRVLYLNLEDSRMKHRRSVKACTLHHKLNVPDLSGWLYIAGANDIGAAFPGGLRLIITDPKTRLGMINEPAFQWLLGEIRKREIEILMLDPFSRLIRGNENAAEVADQLMERLTLLADEAAIAIMIAQHVRKGGGVAIDGVAALRGSSAISDSARNAYGLSKTSPDQMIKIGALFGPSVNLISVDNLKNNLGPLEERSYYRTVSVRLPGGDPNKDPWQVERGRWTHTVERFTPGSSQPNHR